jgi:FkbM family methyltransferase
LGLKNKTYRAVLKLVLFIFKIFDNLLTLVKIDLLYVVCRLRGILNYESDAISGEEYLINNVLPKYIKNDGNTILFDVGANVGNYNQLIHKKFNKASLYSFEPNPITYKKLEVNKSLKSHAFNIGLGDKKGEFVLHLFEEILDSEHASLIKEVHNNRKETPKEIIVQIDTLDDFVIKNNISKIDFLKIDTEGYEFSVLSGGSKLLKENKVSVIQFEFNEMNVHSRTFFLDFHKLLSENFHLFRLSKGKLIDLSHYDTFFEIFKFQNIICINKDLIQSR